VSEALVSSQNVPRWWKPVHVLENGVATLVLSLMTLLPVIEMTARNLHIIPSIPGSPVYVQHMTLWVGLLGGALAARMGRLLSLSTVTFLPRRLRLPAAIFSAAVLAAVATALAYASWEFVVSERGAGSQLVPGIPKWYPLLIMPAGFAVIGLRGIWMAGGGWLGRFVALLGVFVPFALGNLEALASAGVLHLGLALMVLATLAGLPIFAVFGGFAMLLFLGEQTPIASVPVEMYRLVASPLLPSIPLFTFAGYLMVEGGATQRLLRVFKALFSWMPGGMAIVTVVICAVFTWGGSGLTILSLGGLLVPVLIRARYPERFSIGLLTASGSLGLLFPPSLPVILYGVYAQTAIDRLFIGGLLPGLMMVLLVAIYGVHWGIRANAARDRFSIREAAEAIWEAKWELCLPAIMLAGLFGGFGTLTEAAALTAFAALFVETVLYRGLSLRRDYVRVCIECAAVVGGILLIIGVALGFTNYLVDAQIPSQLVDWVKANVHSKIVFLLLLNVALLVVGSLMDIFAAILVIVPLLKPLAVVFGIDPVQMGMIFLSNLELGYLMPPVGINLCLSAYRFEKPMFAVYRALLPFLLVLLCGVFLITYVPWITLAPLRWLGK
jgi:tripartite ATP-independent transporter DctM subunit